MSTFISTKGRYALRAMADLAENQGDGLIPLSEVARRQGISEKYLESIVTVLSKAGFLVGQRGKGGGYRLADEPSAYSVGSILRQVEGPLLPVACLGFEEGKECAHKDSCRTLPIWEGLAELIDSYLDAKTLQDIIDQGTPGVNLMPCSDE